jgi:hypothetical protein
MFMARLFTGGMLDQIVGSQPKLRGKESRYRFAASGHIGLSQMKENRCP